MAGATGITREYADLFEKYNLKWAMMYNREQGRGWATVPPARTFEERNRTFVEWARKGYAVYSEPGYGIYKIFVKKLPEGELLMLREAQRPGELMDVVTSLRVKGYDWKYIVEEVRKKIYWLPEKDIVDRIIEKYIGRENLKRAIYKPEHRIVFAAPVEGINQYYLVEGVGLRGLRDLSFDPVEISTLERGIRPLDAESGVKIRAVLRDYKAGLIDTVDAYERIREIIEKRR